MTESNIDHTGRRRLAELMRLGEESTRIWHTDELGAILRHQLTVPVEFDLGGMEPGAANKLRTLASSEGLLVKSFADLLHHPNAPLALLQLTKHFAKANGVHPESALPADVAKVLYYAAIAVALARCRRRITELDDEALWRGFTWAVQQDWVDDAMRTLLREGLAVLGNEEDTQS